MEIRFLAVHLHSKEVAFQKLDYLHSGRHSRIMADIMMESMFSDEPFSWNQSNMVKADQIRKNYINAIRQGDNGNIEPLIDFARN